MTVGKRLWVVKAFVEGTYPQRWDHVGYFYTRREAQEHVKTLPNYGRPTNLHAWYNIRREATAPTIPTVRAQRRWILQVRLSMGMWKHVAYYTTKKEAQGFIDSKGQDTTVTWRIVKER